METREYGGDRQRFVIAGLSVLFVLLAAGCGGGESDDSASSTESSEADSSSGGTEEAGDDNGTESGAEGEEAESAPEAEPEPEQEAGGGERAVVTIGEEQFSSDQSVVCISLGGAVGGTFFNDAGDIEITIDVPPEDWQSSPDDWQPPSVQVDDARDPQNERQWEAREQNATELTFVPEGASQVDSFSVSGSSASGSATFIDVDAAFVALAEGTDPPEPVTGTFEISCG
jgi:hypothetical protein